MNKDYKSKTIEEFRKNFPEIYQRIYSPIMLAVEEFIAQADHQSYVRGLERAKTIVIEAIDRIAVDSSPEFKGGYRTAKIDAKEFILSSLSSEIENKQDE